MKANTPAPSIVARANAINDAPSLADIETATRAYSQAHDQVVDLLKALNDEIDAVKRKRLAALKAAIREAADLKAHVTAQVEKAPGLFERPRTYQFHGIKVGFKKPPGGLEILDPERTVALIDKHYSKDEAEVLIRTKRTPNKEALEELTAAELKKLAVEIKDASQDVVIVKPTDSEIEKAIKALLADATADAIEEQKQAA